MESHHAVGQRVDDLLAGCAAGDTQALRTLYDLLSPQLFGVALRILKDGRAAEDVLHDAFIQIWRHADKFDARIGSSRAWILSTVRYRAIEKARHQRHDLDTDVPVEAFEMPSAPNVLPSMIGRQEVGQLYHCLNGLPEKSGRAVGLAFLDGLSHEQVSTIIGAPVGTVKSSIRQGLMRLKECLKSHGN